jgi:hypothetical protein
MIRALKGVIWYHRGLEIPSLSNTSSRESCLSAGEASCQDALGGGRPRGHATRESQIDNKVSLCWGGLLRRGTQLFELDRFPRSNQEKVEVP